MPNQNPKILTPADWDELAAIRDVRENFGLEDDQAGVDLSLAAYGAKFDFMTGGPGYIGDLYVIVGDGLSAPPMMFTRDHGKLETVEF